MLNFKKRVVQFINTNGDEEFKKFLLSPFHLNYIYKISNDNEMLPIFNGWFGKNMVNWFKFKSDNGHVLEFYPEYYKYNNIEILIPNTINDFIEDSYRYNFELYWNDLIDELFEPKQYLAKNDIPKYFQVLLEKMGKSFELNL